MTKDQRDKLGWILSNIEDFRLETALLADAAQKPSDKTTLQEAESLIRKGHALLSILRGYGTPHPHRK